MGNLHLEIKIEKFCAPEQQAGNDQNSKCLPVGDHSEFENLWHGDVPQPLEDRDHGKEDHNHERNDEEDRLHVFVAFAIKNVCTLQHRLLSNEFRFHCQGKSEIRRNDCDFRLIFTPKDWVAN